MPDRLGPLAFTDGEWVIGDPAGDHVRLRKEGLSHWVQGVETQQIPWARVMDIVLDVQPHRHNHSKRLRKVAEILSWLGQPTEHVGLPASIGGLARCPYEEWSANFTHHAYRYPRREITAACKLLDEVATSGRVAQLGDAEWLAAITQNLSGHRYGSRALFPRRRAIREVLEADPDRRL
ncbi:hypothetical protein PV410_12250 [Streptomyces sp. PA03-5A]|nr:hypothetical protein [Streptomyces sp. PA03-5A]